MPTLETFDNPHLGREYRVEISAPEFTSVCPKTGLPDFGEIFLSYVPGPRCVELKSFKLDLLGFRDQGIYYEDVTNRILAELVALQEPIEMRVEGRFKPRGGISTTVIATHSAEHER